MPNDTALSPESPRLILGVDPGLRGALAFLDVLTGKPALIERMPVKQGTLDIPELVFLLSYHTLECAFVEQITPRPGQSVQAVKTSAVNFGILLGILQTLDVRTVLVHPAQWTKHMHAEPGVTYPKGSDAKTKSLTVCQALFPKAALTTRKGARPHDGIVDALLIGSFGVRSLRTVEGTGTVGDTHSKRSA